MQEISQKSLLLCQKEANIANKIRLIEFHCHNVVKNRVFAGNPPRGRLVFIYDFGNSADLAVVKPNLDSTGMVRSRSQNVFHDTFRELSSTLIFLQYDIYKLPSFNVCAAIWIFHGRYFKQK